MQIITIYSALQGMVYIPDCFAKESYAKVKEEERKKNAKKSLSGVGPKGYLDLLY